MATAASRMRPSYAATTGRRPALASHSSVARWSATSVRIGNGNGESARSSTSGESSTRFTRERSRSGGVGVGRSQALRVESHPGLVDEEAAREERLVPEAGGRGPVLAQQLRQEDRGVEV